MFYQHPVDVTEGPRYTSSEGKDALLLEDESRG